MFEIIILGVIQGIAEWLPVSSEGMVVFASTFFSVREFSELVELAIWLHMGTFFAALVYFWKDVVHLAHQMFQWKRASRGDRQLIIFLVLSTLISGSIGLVLLQALEGIMVLLGAESMWIVMLIGVSLLVTGCLQLRTRVSGLRHVQDVSVWDAVILGVVQGFAIVPGLSRSGLTIAALLLRKFDDVSSLRISFLMSLPLVLGANIVLSIDDWVFSFETLVGAFVAFVFGLATIHVLMHVARKVNFGWFVLGFGVLMIISAFV